MCIRLVLFLLCFSGPVLAQNAAPEVPVISFAKQVDIVVAAKKDPRIFEMKIAQEKDNVLLTVITDKSLDRSEAKEMALNLVMLTKGRSLDDHPKEKDKPGKGLYNYRVSVSRPDGVVLVTALKPKAKEKVTFEDPFLPRPLTRADVNGQ